MKTNHLFALAFTLVAAAPLPAQEIALIVRKPAEAVPAPTPTPDPKTATNQPVTTPSIAATPPAPAAPIDPHIVRMTLADGSIISGKLSITALAIDTKFGRLAIPIEKIRYVKPGLDSRAGMKEKTAQWLEQLGSDNVETRKAASAELLKLGLPIRETLRGLLQDSSALRVAEAKALIDKLNEAANLDELDPADLTTLDVIATTDFTMTGRIVPQSFDLASDFGDLKMQLTQLVRLDRDTGTAAEERKTITVSQENFIARSMKSTGIRVEKGDKLTLRATGQLNMTRWNTTATPDGSPNTGWYLNGKIYNGAVCMRIGSSGQVIKVGSALTHTATETGVLHLGIAMINRFAQDGVDYPGEFKVDVKLQKK